MSLSAREQQALESIEDGLAESDPGLASRLGIFSRLASGEEMPERDEIQPIRPSATDRLDRNRSPRRIVVLGVRAPEPAQAVPTAGLASGRGAAVASHLRRADRSRAGAKQPRSCRMRAIVGNSMYRAGARPRCAAGRQVERQRAV
jgi:hypothetical protein